MDHLAAAVVRRFLRATLEYNYGVDGKDLSWQADFDPTTPCVKCGKQAELALVVRENFNDAQTPEQQKFITRMHANNEVVNGQKLFWPHDCVALATYVCRDFNCTTMTTLWNQA